MERKITIEYNWSNDKYSNAEIPAKHQKELEEHELKRMLRLAVETAIDHYHFNP